MSGLLNGGMALDSSAGTIWVPTMVTKSQFNEDDPQNVVVIWRMQVSRRVLLERRQGKTLQRRSARSNRRAAP